MSAVLRRSTLLQEMRPKAELGTYFVQTWGCQMNEEDSEQIGLNLENIGFKPASSLKTAQVVILNTCSVRKKPEDKAFSLLGELRILKQKNPDMVIGVCGCMAQVRANDIRQAAPHVDFVLGTGDIGLVAGLVEEALQTRKFQKRLELPERKGAVVTQVPTRKVSRAPKLKAFVPIQYGCDKFCTFCIVPTTRGRERSRPTEDILQEVQALAAQGTKEVTLLGQTVNSYGKNLLEGRVPFSELLLRLSQIEGLERIRYTSPYPRDFKEDLLKVIQQTPQVMEHLHMPLQSGSNEVLKAMRRLYTRESFSEIIDSARALMPNIGLTTDIIVGFPGETDSQFEETVDMVEKIRFDGAYMFLYSPRPNTPAAEMEQVPLRVRKQRLNHLISVQNRITVENHEARIGQVFEVLVEGRSQKNPEVLSGYSREFHMMHFKGDDSLIGQLVQVKAERPHQWGLFGSVV